MKTIIRCRICGGKKLKSVFSLGEQYLTGVFPRNKNQEITKGPVELVKCVGDGDCGLVQLRQSYDVEQMYGMNYGYRSGLNASMVAHLHSKVDKILLMGILKKGDAIIDIGSNDATTLKRYPKDTYKLFGVDPTGIKFSQYYDNEITLIDDFFTSKILNNRLGSDGAKVITSFSMFYDLENPVEFASEIESVLADDGIWVSEQSYLPAMLKTNSFDTICHEHLDFYALKQILWIADKAGLKILDVEFNDVNGGSFSFVAAKKTTKLIANDINIDNIVKNENKDGINTEIVFETFNKRVAEAGVILKEFLLNAKSEGKRVCGVGASTKGNVLLQYFNITNDLLENIGEVNHDKYGSFTPGTLIPIISEEEMLMSNPDYLLILPWHFKNFFIENLKFKGRKLIIPLPQFEIIIN